MFSGASLQSAIFSQLQGSADLTTLIGSNRIFDDVPDGTKPPYVEFGRSSHANNDTSTEAGESHAVQLLLWTDYKGRKPIFELAEIIVAALESMDPDLGTHHLVSLRFQDLTIEYDRAAKSQQGAMTFRSITEPK